jgi:hypothetical protein
MRCGIRPSTKEQQQGDGDAHDGYADQYKRQRVAFPKRIQPAGMMMSAHFSNVPPTSRRSMHPDRAAVLDYLVIELIAVDGRQAKAS